MKKIATETLETELTPTQVRALKLAKEGDLHPREGGRWTHLDAQVTYAKTDRFKERPQAVKVAITKTVNQLRECGLLRELDPDIEVSGSPHGITMAGKIWLLKRK